MRYRVAGLIDTRMGIPSFDMAAKRARYSALSRFAECTQACENIFETFEKAYAFAEHLNEESKHIENAARAVGLNPRAHDPWVVYSEACVGMLYGVAQWGCAKLA